MQQEFIQSSLSTTSLQIRPNALAKENFSVDWHFHEEIEILWIQEGKKEIYINGASYILNKNDIIFINEYVPHKTYTYKNTSTFLLQFKLHQFYSGPFISSLKKRSFFIFNNGTHTNILLCNSLNAILKEYSSQEKSFQSFIQSYIYTILAIFYRNDILTDPNELVDLQKILPIIEYIETHYNEPISLNDVSIFLNLNKSYLCRLFKNVTGLSFMNYLYKYRLNNAEYLLLHSEKNITEIAYEVGFSSSSYFAKIFRIHKGYTPSFYKKLQKR